MPISIMYTKLVYVFSLEIITFPKFTSLKVKKAKPLNSGQLFRCPFCLLYNMDYVKLLQAYDIHTYLVAKLGEIAYCITNTHRVHSHNNFQPHLTSTTIQYHVINTYTYLRLRHNLRIILFGAI